VSVLFAFCVSRARVANALSGAGKGAQPGFLMVALFFLLNGGAQTALAANAISVSPQWAGRGAHSERPRRGLKIM